MNKLRSSAWAGWSWAGCLSLLFAGSAGGFASPQGSTAETRPGLDAIQAAPWGSPPQLTPQQVAAILRQWEGPSDAKAREEALFRSALWLAATGRQEQAIGIYQGVIDRYPGSEEAGWARIRLGDLYRQYLKRPEEAPAVYAAVAAEFSGKRLEGWALVKLAEAYNETGRHDLARETYSRGLAAATDKTAVTNHIRLTCYWLNASGKKSQVLAAMEALSTAPIDPLVQAGARRWIIGFADAIGDKARAEAQLAAWGELLALRQLESGTPDSLLAALSKIKARLARLDPRLASAQETREQVVSYYRERVQSTTGEARCRARYLLGGAQLLAGKSDAAIKSLEEFLETCRETREREIALVALGLAFARAARVSEGETFFLRLLLTGEREDSALVAGARGLCLVLDGTPEGEGALRRLGVLFSCEPDPRAARTLWRARAFVALRRATADYREGHYLSAIPVLEDALSRRDLLGPEAPLLLYLLGDCYQAARRDFEAISCLQEALGLNPADPRASGSRYMIAVCHYRLGNYAIARERFAAVLADKPIGPASQSAKDYIRRCDEGLRPGATEQKLLAGPDGG